MVSGDRDEVRNFLKSGVDVNAGNSEGLTALHVTPPFLPPSDLEICNANLLLLLLFFVLDALQEAVAQENHEMIELLLESGANIDVQDNEGWTPLHAVCQYGFMDTAKFLLSHKANPAMTNFDNHLPVDLIEGDEDLEGLMGGVIPSPLIPPRCHQEPSIFPPSPGSFAV